MTLLEELQTQLAENLQRQSIVDAGSWAENYVVLGKPLPGPMRFTKHPWSRIWCNLNEDWVGKKGAQMAMTNSAIVRAIYTVDIRKNDVLYILPKKNPDAADFSKAKFDPLLDLSPHLKNLFSNTRNVGHKQAGNVNLFIRGSRSRSALKSISVGLRIYDEYDEMLQRNLALSEERSSGYEEKDTQTIKLSTPTFPDFGITKDFEETTQDHFFFKCPFCSTNGRPTWTELLDLSNLMIPTESPSDRDALRRSYLITGCCKHKLPEDKSLYLQEHRCKWEQTANRGQSSVRGFWIPQLYSMTKPLHKIAKQVLQAKTDPIMDGEVHNSVLAKEYVAPGARISVEMVNVCKRDHLNQSSPRSKIVTMGVDVGQKELYVEISEYLVPPNLGSALNSQSVAVARALLTVPDFSHLGPLMYQYQVLHAVVDVDPAYREAVDFAKSFNGHVNLCRFVRNIDKRSISPEDGTSELVRQVSRTIWLDQSQSRFRDQKILLPKNLPHGYENMIAALIKKQERDKDGNITAKYTSIGADHWAFARVYNEIALPLAVSVLENKNVEAFL